MLKKYIDAYANNFIETHTEAQKVDLWIYQSIDKIIVWIVSLSTGSIALLLTNADKLKLDQMVINCSLGSLLSSIILGITGRVIYFEANKLYKKVTDTFTFDLRLMQLQFFPSHFSKNETTESIYHRIKDDFDFDVKDYLGVTSAKEFGEKYDLDQAKELYVKIYKYCKRLNREALAEVNKILNKIFDRDEEYELNEKDIKKIKAKKVKESTAHKVLVTSKVFYYLSLFCFVLAVMIITVAYIKSHL